MARTVAVFRLLVLLVRRDAVTLKTVGLNNLLFCALFVAMGSSARHAFWSTFLFQLVLLLPLLAAMASDALARIPPERIALWPLTTGERLVVRVGGVAFSPMFWVLGLGIGVWAGAAAGLVMAGLAVVVQVMVFAVSLLGGRPKGVLLVPKPPGRMGRLVQVQMRHLLSTLDFYTACLLCAVGCAYRWLAQSPDDEAFPILAMLVAIALSTFAQRSFGLETPGSMARYRLLPLAGSRLLLAKDAAYLGVAAALVAPLNFRAGMSFSLMAVALGRYPSLREKVAQRPWRFTGGSARFGVLQIVGGGLMGLASFRVSAWFLVGSAAVWAGSVWLGDRWWRDGLR